MTFHCKLPAFFGFGTTIIAALTLTLPLALLVPVLHALPVWHDSSRNSIDSFITGSTFLLAGGVKFGVPYYLTTPLPSGTEHYSFVQYAPCNPPFISHEAAGSTGNLTVSPRSSSHSAPLFSVHNGQLLHHMNESHFLYVNAMNVTQDMNGSTLFGLSLASQRDGLQDAVWRWRGNYLYLDDGQSSNHGLYYRCVSRNRGECIYTSFDIISSPECGVVTLHSINIAVDDEPDQRPLSP